MASNDDDDVIGSILGFAWKAVILVVLFALCHYAERAGDEAKRAADEIQAIHKAQPTRAMTPSEADAVADALSALFRSLRAIPFEPPERAK